MKSYELTYLISSKLSEEEAGGLQTKITSLIQEEGGALVQEKFPFRKNLAYPVKKQSQAFLAFINFKISPEKLTDLEKKLKTESQILRYLMLTKMPLKKMRAVHRTLRGPKIEETKSLPLGKPKKEKKVELKEIEKKLEEILE